MELYPGRDTFEFDKGHVIKNQPITVLVLLSDSLGRQQEILFDIQHSYIRFKPTI